MISDTKLVCISIFLSVLLNVKATVNYDVSNNVKFKYSFDGSETVIVISSSETKSPTTNVIVQARLVSSANSTGWNILEVLANQNREDEEQAYYAGYAEGCLSTKLIYQHWYNTVTKFCEGKEATCEKIYDFIRENDNWISGMIKKHKNSNKYWWQVNLLYLQLEGIYEGYSKCRHNNETPLTYRDFLFMNMDGDLEDLSDKFGSGDASSGALDDHCSAIIKLLPNHKDLFVAHNMWGRYNHMNRILKKYILRYHQLPNSKELIPGEVITMSSYPGVLNSLDDFYIMSSNIVAQETSIENYNENLWKFVKPSKVLTFARAMIANRLATDGKSWTKVFSKYNSGTYNNQWMIVDYNKFTPGKSPRNGLLWILEQLPGHVKAEDQTKILIKNEYWPSYNIAFYTSIFTLSGNDKMVKKYGDWFSYHGAPRAKIMKRDHKRIKALDSLMYFMRSNDYKNDPLSKCNCTPPYSASNAIAARHDLNQPNGTYPFKYVAQRGGGAIDAKITSSALVKKVQFIAISGPTTGISLPVFKWSTSDYDKKLLHLGQPDKWDFEPILTDWVYK